MFFELFKKVKTKTLLVAAGFLVLAGIFGFSLWFYFSFLKSGGFLKAVPAESSVYWQSDFSQGADNAWLWTITRAILPKEAASRTNFLENFVAPEASRIGFAILPDSSDFIFFGQIDAAKFEGQKSKIEKLNYHYVFEDNNRIIISNSRLGLEEAIAALSKEKKSFADDKMKLVSLNKARRRSPAQIYFEKNFKVENFLPLPWSSDFWSSNELFVDMKNGVEAPRSFKDYEFLSILDDKYLKNNLEKVVKDNLAVLLPEIRDKILSDGTAVKELFANPDIFVFQDEQIGGMSARYLSVRAIDQEFLVGKGRQGAMISNSTEFIQDFLSNFRRQPDYYGKSLGELILDGLKWLTPDFGGIIFEVSPFVWG